MKIDHPGSRQVRQQYERFPYPPLPWPALPQRGQGRALRYESGLALAQAHKHPPTDRTSHQGIRILVAGCGTLEALVVAQNHPHAHAVVAVDLSKASLKILRRRLRWMRLRNLYTLAGCRGHGLPPIHLLQADLNTFTDDPFDYILVSNVLHHVADPGALLAHLSGMLKDNGLLRVVTYPGVSRYWLRQTGAWLHQCGLGPHTPGLKKKARACIARLPVDHPLRNCFESHRETRHLNGLVDVFLHVLENPLSPLAWQQASARAGLSLLGEAQQHQAQGGFLSELAPETQTLDTWTRLQIMDDLLELNTNPVWWFLKTATVPPDHHDIGQGVTEATGKPHANCLCRGITPAVVADKLRDDPAQTWTLPSQCYSELGSAVRDAKRLLRGTTLSITALIDTLRQQVGPHLDAHGQVLHGLSIGEYDTQALLQAIPPWQEEQWRELQQRLDGQVHLFLDEQIIPGHSLPQQARWLQLRYGAEQAMIQSLRLVLLQPDIAGFS